MNVDPESPFSAAGSGARRIEDERFRAEVRRIYATSHWVGPVGSLAAALTTAALLWGDLRHGILIGWLVWAGLGIAGMVSSILVPPIRRWESATGLPHLTFFAHTVIGVAFGSLLWLDPSMVERDALRWFALTVMFAMSAGVASGLNGLSNLGLRVLVPMWALGLSALTIGGHWLVALGGTAFVAVVVVDLRRSGELWRELVNLRIDQEHRTEQQRWFAQHDGLTGLPNRAGVMAALDQVQEGEATAMYIDLDFFKEVNDQFGHAAGDEVLAEVARRLKATMREDDVVGRLGGDEFFVLFGRPLTADRLTALGTRIIASIEMPIAMTAGVAKISVSLGAATLNCDRATGIELMQRADAELMRAKRGGRRRTEVFSESG